MIGRYTVLQASFIIFFFFLYSGKQTFLTPVPLVKTIPIYLFLSTFTCSYVLLFFFYSPAEELTCFREKALFILAYMPPALLGGSLELLLETYN